ncbi:hypothetical protein M0811_08181 [Anaeramoeba ignava]|uniref:Uncharacterized protein n=1 Tax=Anaeramoeba ignava TaxID=1746090 RepID=A0A9Q0LJF8_ANAIG|nr:hypothetical protein M0811_08181 [Anaeramoeba ignava]
MKDITQTFGDQKFIVYFNSKPMSQPLEDKNTYFVKFELFLNQRENRKIRISNKTIQSVTKPTIPKNYNNKR